MGCTSLIRLSPLLVLCGCSFDSAPLAQPAEAKNASRQAVWAPVELDAGVGVGVGRGGAGPDAADRGDGSESLQNQRVPTAGRSNGSSPDAGEPMQAAGAADSAQDAQDASASAVQSMPERARDAGEQLPSDSVADGGGGASDSASAQGMASAPASEGADGTQPDPASSAESPSTDTSEEPTQSSDMNEQGEDSEAPSDTTVAQRFVDAVESVFDPSSGKKQRGSTAEIKRWRNLARRSDRLSASIVTPALSAVARSGACFVRPEPCVQVCVTVEQDCLPCLLDSDCREVLWQVCGSLPGGICGVAGP